MTEKLVSFKISIKDLERVRKIVELNTPSIKSNTQFYQMAVSEYLDKKENELNDLLEEQKKKEEKENGNSM